MSQKSENEEIVAQGIFTHSIWGKKCFITLTNQRLIITKTSAKSNLLSRLIITAIIGLTFFSIKAFSDSYYNNAALLCGTFMLVLLLLLITLPIYRLRRMMNFSLAERLSAFPDNTSVHPLQNVTFDNSLLTGNKLRVGTEIYRFDNEKNIPLFESALKQPLPISEKQQISNMRQVDTSKQKHDGRLQIRIGIYGGIITVFLIIFRSEILNRNSVIDCVFSLLVIFGFVFALTYLGSGYGILKWGVPGNPPGQQVRHFCPYCHHVLGGDDLPTPGLHAICPKCGQTFGRTQW